MKARAHTAMCELNAYDVLSDYNHIWIFILCNHMGPLCVWVSMELVNNKKQRRLIYLVTMVSPHRDLFTML